MPSPESPILFQSGPLTIRWYGVLMVAAVLAGAYVARIEAKQRGEDPEHVANLLIWCLIFGIVGARLYHIFSSPPGASRDFSYYFVEQPFVRLILFGIPVLFPTALFIWQGGIGIFGALLGGVVAVIIYSRRHRLDGWRWLDIVSPGMLLGQAIGRWGNFFNQELYGTPTTLPWGITITNVNQRLAPYNDLTTYPLDAAFHPVFLYESVWNLVGFGLLLWLGRRRFPRLRSGRLFAFYLIWYAVGRFFIEALRPDAWLIFGLPTAQIMSGLLAAVGAGIFYITRSFRTSE